MSKIAVIIRIMRGVKEGGEITKLRAYYPFPLNNLKSVIYFASKFSGYWENVYDRSDNSQMRRREGVEK